MHRLSRRVLTRVGRRGATLLFLAMIALIYAVSLVNMPPENRAAAGTVFLVELLPLPVWACGWAGVGGLCLVQAFLRTDRAAFAAASLLMTAWGTLYLLGWALDRIPRGYVSAAVWLGFAAFVQVIAGWREHHQGG